MRRTTKIRAAALTAAAMMLTGAVGFSSTPAGATVATATSGFVSSPVDAGHLALEIRNNVVTVARFNTGNVRVAAETFTYSFKGCTLSPTLLATEKRYLGFSTTTTSPGGVVAVDSNGLGTKFDTKPNCTRADGRLEAPDSITIALNETLLKNTQIDAVELDLEGKGNPFYVITTNGEAATNTSGVRRLANSSDVGPDSGPGDNNKVTFGAKSNNADDFTSITIKVVPGPLGETGAIGLDGGGDYAGLPLSSTNPNLNSKGTFDSIFHLVTSEKFEYSVGCGDVVQASATADGINSTNGDGADSLVASIRYIRLPNKNTTACPAASATAAETRIGVEIQASPQFDANANLDNVFINNSSTSANGTLQDVRSRVSMVWVVETAGKTAGAVEAELARDIDKTPLDGPTATPAVPVVYCTNVPAQVALNPMPSKEQWEAELTLSPPTPLAMSLLAPIDHPDGTPWCLLSDTRVISGTTITQTQIYSGNGDPRWA